MPPELNDRIFVAGHKGLVGNAIVKNLELRGFENIIVANKNELDLKDSNRVNDFFAVNDIDYVYDAAAKVGGIHANNTYPAEFIYDNLTIQNNIINACYEHGVKKMIFLGSVCIYPKYAPEPVKEESLLTSHLEPTNEPYAIAKIAGIKMCQAYRKQYGSNFISVMPCNLYGENDNFHPQNSHVLPALIRRFHEAKVNNASSVTCWGTGSARREFMDADDLADALTFLMDVYDSGEIINIGYGIDYTIKEVTETIKEIVGFKGEILWDTTKPDGTPRRMLDSTKLTNLGWRPKISLYDGLSKAYTWYIKTNGERIK
jgi:GDP-L-fucose synthase